MRGKRIISFIVLMSLLALVVTNQGCSSSNGIGVWDMAKMMPDGINRFTFIDTEAIRGDDNLEYVYEAVEGNFDYTLDILGIDFDDVNSVAWASDPVILNGNFDLDDVREELDENGWEADEYKDVEIWKQDLGYEWIALMGSYIIAGLEEGVKNSIEVIEEEEGSIQYDRDFKDVVDMLPDGLSILYSTYEEYEDQEASGISIQKINNDTLRTTAVYKFQDEDAAEDAAVYIENNAEDAGLYNVSVSQNNEYVESTAEIDIEGFPL